jgi:hypothetical protein
MEYAESEITKIKKSMTDLKKAFDDSLGSGNHNSGEGQDD